MKRRKSKIAMRGFFGGEKLVFLSRTALLPRTAQPAMFRYLEFLRFPSINGIVNWKESNG